MILCKKKKIAALLCVCMALVLTVIGIMQLPVFAQPVSSEAVSPDFSNALKAMFKEAYELEEYAGLPQEDAPHLILEADEMTGETAQFEQYLQTFAEENGCRYIPGGYDEHLKQINSEHRSLDLRVIVSAEKTGENTYAVKLTIFVTPSCSTSAVSSVTVDPISGDVSYQIVKLSMA